jgi:hypothetical protein
VSRPADSRELQDTVNTRVVEANAGETTATDRRTTEGRTCKGVTKNGVPCKSVVIGKDGFCRVHSQSKRHDLSESGRKGGIASGAVRRARRDRGGKNGDATVRARLRREGLKRSDEIAAALARGLGASDPTVAVRAARALLEEGFGRVPAAVPDEDLDPASMVTALFRRPARNGDGERLYGLLRDGRLLEILPIVDDEEPDAAA